MTALRHTVIRRLDVGHDRRPGWRFVAGFDDPDDADAVRRELDSQAKDAAGNPFRFAAFADLCSLPEFVYADWVQEGGVSPPSPRANGTRNWAAWWDDRLKF